MDRSVSRAHYSRETRTPRAWQVFDVLAGVAAFELNGAIDVPPRAAHVIRHESTDDLNILVIASLHSHGDRVAECA